MALVRHAHGPVRAWAVRSFTNWWQRWVDGKNPQSARNAAARRGVHRGYGVQASSKSLNLRPTGFNGFTSLY